jgi:hypothetical protein
MYSGRLLVGYSSTLKMEAALSSEMVIIYHSTQSNMLEDTNLHNHRWEQCILQYLVNFYLLHNPHLL